ncbi:unnamed protein product [Paramecium octaurelia]|uniref:P-loop containing nucleoside triphosphate hydrolase n=1 Tax=Paramecium octaurelia TaxID=43137 RepID=A0A8S1SXZ6_PAROT|nr:unnamed protein product [Paramecium octaurelia]
MDLQQMYDEVIDTNNIKIVVLGAEGVGKSSIINQLCDRQFDLEIKSTTCYKIDKAEYIINDQQYNLSFWDCGSYHNQSYQDVKKAFYRGSLFAFLVVDATCTDQLKSTIQFWDQECEDYNVFTKYVLVNKMDLVDDIEVMNCNKTISIGQMIEEQDHSHIQMINQNLNQIDHKDEIKLMISNLELNTQCFFGSAKKKEMGYKDFLIKLIKDNNIFNLQKADSDRRIQKNRQNESSIRQSLPIESQRKSSEQVKCNIY